MLPFLRVRGEWMAGENGKALEDSWLRLEEGSHGSVKVSKHH